MENLEFSVSTYGKLEKVSDTLSKVRVRIFYKYGNRNGTYITDQFAEKLLSTLPYAPLKGIYDFEEEDYTDHGTKRTQGRIYGVIPENPNIAWEIHLDEDGVEREYACADALIFTGLYEEASEIIGKGQSMEIYSETFKGKYQYINGKKYFVFEDGCFLGLQILGDEVAPCFEGASFYSLSDELEQIFKEVKEYSLRQKENTEGEQEMEKSLVFKLSDNEKYNALMNLLNPSEDLEIIVCDVYEEYAVCWDCKNAGYLRAFYTKNDEEDSVAIDRTESCFIVDVNEAEKAALKNLNKLNNDTFEKVDENYSTILEEKADFEEKNSQNETKIGELEETLSTLQTENEGFVAQIAENEQLINELREENKQLNDFKLEIELKEKEAVLETYSQNLSTEILERYSNALSNYTVESLKKELAYEFVTTNPTVFSKQSSAEQIIPKIESKSALETLLDRHSNK